MTTSKPAIAIDIDGVLIYEEVELWIDYFERKTGQAFNREVFAKTHNWNDATGLDIPTLSDLYVAAHQELTTHMRPVAGAMAAIQALQHFSDPHVITARDTRVQDTTIALLKKHFGNSFISHSFGHVESKVAAVQALGAVAFIDDSAYQAQLVAEQTDAQVIYFPQLRGLHHLLHGRNPQIIYPPSADEFREGMSEAEAEKVHERTWPEIVAICQQIVGKPAHPKRA